MQAAKDGSKVRMVRLAGFVGLTAALLNAATDVIYQGVTSGAYDSDMSFMWEISDARLRLGAFLGAAVIPFAIIGFWHVHQGIKRAGRFLAAAPVLVGSYAAAVGTAAHFSLIFPALAGQRILEAGGEPVPVLQQLNAEMLAIVSDLFWVVLGFWIFSIWWMILVFMGKTDYPRWAGILNPTFLMFGLYFLFALIPGPVSSHLVPASSALSFAVFFGFSIRFLWNCDT
jgi:hypothetical protein